MNTALGFLILWFILVAIANFRLFYKLKAVKSILPLRGGKSLPELGVGVELPPMEFVDQKGRTVKLGCGASDFYILLTSLTCSACRHLDVFLATHGDVLKSEANLYLATFDDRKLLQNALWPSDYSIFSAERLQDLVKTGTVPVIFKVVNCRVVGAFLINTGEQLLSIVVPELT